MASAGCGVKQVKSMASVIAQLEKSGAAQKMLPTAVNPKPFGTNLKPVNATGGTGGAGLSSAPPKIALKPPPVTASEKPSPGLKKVTPFKPADDTAAQSTVANGLKFPGTSYIANKPTPPVSTKPELKPSDTAKKPAWQKKPSPIDVDKTPASQLEAPENNSNGDRRSTPISPVTSGPSPAVKTFGPGARATLPRANPTEATPTLSSGKESSILSRKNKLNEIEGGDKELENDSHNDPSPKPAPSIGKKFSSVVTGQKNLAATTPIAGKLNVPAAMNGAANTNVVKSTTPSWRNNKNENKPQANASLSPVSQPMVEKEEVKEESDEEDYENPNENLNKAPTLPPSPLKSQTSENSNKNPPLRPPAKSPGVQPSNPTLTKSPSTLSSNKENTAVVVVVHATTGKRYRRLPLPRLGAAKPPKKLAKPREIELERFREVLVAVVDEEMYEDASSESVSTGTGHAMTSSGANVRGGVSLGSRKVVEVSVEQEIYEAVD